MLTPEDQIENSPKLAALTDRVRREIGYFSYYTKPWVKQAMHPSGERVYDVAVIGAGQNGLGIFHGLKQNGISNTLIIDENPMQAAGNFAQYDRMLSLRTPKDLTGLDFGLASLTFRSFWEALHPGDAWTSLEKVSRAEWDAYLKWYRSTLEIPVRYEHRLVRLERETPQMLRLVVEGGQGGELQFFARAVVFATGFQAEAIKRLPMDVIGDTDRAHWAHSADSIDFAALWQKRVAILGHGAGSFDAAAMALEAKALSAMVCYRRPSMPRVNPFRRLELAGLMGNFNELDEETRWKIVWLVSHRDQPAPELAMKRVRGLAGFSVRSGVGWKRIERSNDGLQLTLSNGEKLVVDFAIFATGFERRPLERPELASLASEIARWEDFTPPKGYASGALKRYPRHGRGYELLPKGSAPDQLVSHIFNFGFSSGLDHGPHITSISGIHFSLQRVVDGVRGLLTKLDEDAYFEDFAINPPPEAYLEAYPDIIGES
ncbi:MAG: NAD(P)/FAD-dependent oxidoreductase [Opitutales bacterium]|nr:NAD(P)/FAD-dependent oxidoreductase [Opitutales bacterium]NRA28094.1 NAD(P)/FAD-dependent oxidoreductase [Opitutales bacterium]